MKRKVFLKGYKLPQYIHKENMFLSSVSVLLVDLCNGSILISMQLVSEQDSVYGSPTTQLTSKFTNYQNESRCSYIYVPRKRSIIKQEKVWKRDLDNWYDKNSAIASKYGWVK